ncbi:cysteine sulfinate desulfinase [Dechloromonas denitrificans]|uniref:Cysteine desulfurase n=1 Tax=Dechloromonas denitrificans TaxID=281362 RepID=A0A133XLL3_9RHOO|nr:cysteine desulfurase [Dechloromonas denitrificans]KXB31808.1 cysteine sulfinate desulfinase [Dechloromonas denitrificans]
MLTALNTSPTARLPALDVARLRQDFPILQRAVHGQPLVYLDNAATSQKPWSVIEAERHYYAHYNANIHRGVHQMSQEATEAYEAARDRVRDFIHASSREEIIFTRGTTESINLVASSFGQRLQAGDEILITEMEHHSNIVPWQLLCQRSGALLRVAPIDDAGQLCVEQFAKLLGPRTRLVALSHMSNALGSINPVKKLVNLAHQVGAVVLLDGAQAVAHLPVNVMDIDCDFYAFSGHKLYGPTGIGVLYARRAILDSMPPYQGGGDMIREVRFAGSSWNDLPYKFEAGTPNIAGGIGLGAALDYVGGVGLAAIAAHESELLRYATALAGEFPGLTQIGTAADKGAILSFTLAGIHPHDIGTILDSCGVAVRTGHHCAMPVMEHFGVPATVRASFALYNTRHEIDTLFQGLTKAREMFG